MINRLPPEVFERLIDLRQQQERSIQNIEKLRDEHRDWQKCFDDLLANIKHEKNENWQNCIVPVEHSKFDDARRANFTSIAPPAGDMDTAFVDTDGNGGSDGDDGNVCNDGNGDEINTETGSPIATSVVTETIKRHASGPLRKMVEQELFHRPSATLVDPVFFSKTRCPALQTRIQRIVQSGTFECVTGCVIFVNLITIGLEAQTSLMNEEEFQPWSWPWVSERIFLLVYCLELTLRFIAGSNIFNDFWFFLDACLVITGFTALVILPMTVGEIAGLGAEKFLLVRGIRLLRLVRALRMFKHFKVMWRLVNGLLTAGKTLLSTSVLLLVSLFIFSCIAVELIAKDEYLASAPATAAIVRKHFWGVDLSMVTLMQFVTLDSAASIYFPLIMERPGLCLYFLLIIFVISIGLMNLVTAVVLENAMESAAEEAEEERSSLKSKVKEAIPELLEIFKRLDKDKSGILTRDEMEIVDDNLLPRRLLDSACVGSILDFFDFLDVEEKGELSQQDFVEGLLNLCLLDMPISAIQTLKLLQMVLRLSKKIDQNVEVLRART